MPAANKLTIAALLAITVSIAGCNSSKKASSSDSGAAATTAAAAPAASAADSGAAAGASTPAAPAAAATGAAGCALTAAQVTSAMGTTYGTPQNFNGICMYPGANPLSIDVLDGQGDNDFAATLATAVQDQGTDTTTAIPGLGDKATGVGQEIVVQSGGKVIDIRGAENGFGNWPKSIALAKLVIAGLR